jgi:ribonuclease HI
MPTFTCVVCNATFDLPQATLERFPGWTPRHCRAHRPGSAAKQPATKAPAGGASFAGARGGGGRGRSLREENRSVADVMATHSGGPDNGIFTDGSCDPNPGPGGWGLVRVRDGESIAMLHGQQAQTTNNQMEMMAVIKALELLGPDEAETIWSDSQLVIKTLTEWARGWERNGWKRKSGPIANLELVQQGWALMQQRPKVKLQWVPGHSGHKWNEVADSLATAWMRSGV